MKKLKPYATKLYLEQIRFLRRQKGEASRWLRAVITAAIERDKKENTDGNQT